ncbi:MAG TPA: DUF2243 domain-containing protein, partial [Arenibaculum sp.]|nr:DUF2243 domain-containing protein [Arenibaculum sp.]
MAAAFTGTFRWAGYLIGFAMGGFFDGILLHQVLQWHHLLSAVEGPAFRDLRVQVLADGIFHAAMYAVAAAGLWLLWRTRHQFARAGADRLLFAGFLVGFGAWHVADGILFHWILGIHRIRMAADAPLAWDLLFFVPGVLLVVAGWLLRGTIGPGPGTAPCGRCPRSIAPVLLAAAVLAAGSVAALPPSGATSVAVLFGPGTTQADVFAALTAVDGRAVWSDRTGKLWDVDVGEAGRG